ncbi:MAG: XRE family transcriptional regulator [Thiothrix sp.]|nr:MAG: XRE family transcriptional regulator [Thiothrix sp.]
MMDELEIRRIFAANLKLVMDRNDLNAKDVERRTGVTSRMVGYILNIERSPTIDIIRKLSVGLRVPISDFFSSDDGSYKVSIADFEHLELLNKMTQEEREELERYANYLIEKRS